MRSPIGALARDIRPFCDAHHDATKKRRRQRRCVARAKENRGREAAAIGVRAD